MGAIANLTLLNAAAGNVTYKPEKADGEVAVWADDSAGFINGYRYATIKKAMGRNVSEDKSRIRTTVTYPVVDANGATLRVHACYVEYMFAPGATGAERQELYARQKSFDASTPVKDAVETLFLPL